MFVYTNSLPLSKGTASVSLHKPFVLQQGDCASVCLHKLFVMKQGDRKVCLHKPFVLQQGGCAGVCLHKPFTLQQGDCASVCLRKPFTLQQGDCASLCTKGGAPWFVGKLSRNECEELLMQHGKQQHFVVRESTTLVSTAALCGEYSCTL